MSASEAGAHKPSTLSSRSFWSSSRRISSSDIVVLASLGFSDAQLALRFLERRDVDDFAQRRIAGQFQLRLRLVHHQPQSVRRNASVRTEDLPGRIVGRARLFALDLAPFPQPFDPAFLVVADPTIGAQERLHDFFYFRPSLFQSLQIGADADKRKAEVLVSAGKNIEAHLQTLKER